ncbi:hypothetical protein RI367_001414 [Sorochytrium milnesiophthora]
MKFPAQQHIRKLLKALGSEATGVVYVRGDVHKTLHDTDTELPFRQESNFYYLTGCAEADCHVVVDIKSQQSTLFTPKIDKDEQVWIGVPPSLKDFADQYDVHHVQHNDHLEETLKSLQPDVVHVLRTDDETVDKLGAFKTKASNKLLPDALITARLTKTQYEIDTMRRANDISSKAHVAVFEACGKYIAKQQQHQANGNKTEGESEMTLEAVFRYECHRRGGAVQAYLPIFGAGSHAAVLHYGKNTTALATVTHSNPDALLLVDAGCAYQVYASDITRCVPIANGGRFTDRSRTVYQTVLDAQMAVLSKIKPGVQWEELHRVAERVIAEGLLKAGILKGGSVDECLKAHAQAVFFPHGLGHSIGLDVHDVGGYPHGVPRINEPGIRYLRMRRVLEEGMVMTVEPGLYFVPLLIEEAKGTEAGKYIDFDVVAQYMNVGGVRIEDNVVVTANGHDNLTPAPKTVEDVEKIVANAMKSV